MRKRIIVWFIMALFLMIGCPWLAVTFAGSMGMAVCFLLFFSINPLFAAFSGAFAGQNIKRLWALPIITSGLFLAGAWLFFEMSEIAFLWYGVGYLVIGVALMLVSALLKGKK